MSRGPIHRIDPSRTRTLRRKLELEFMRRFDKLMRMINELVVSRDAFGIAVANSVDAGRGDNRGGIVAQNDRFTFATDSEKLNQFSQWLATQVSTEIITIGFGQPTDDAFWTQYIWQAYQKGMERAFDDLNKAKRFSGGVADFYAGTKQEFLQQSFGHPVSIERVKQLSSRVLTELEGVTAAMETQMKRELLDGLTQGLSPKQVARNINDRVEKIGKTRARAIAQTECLLPETLVDAAMVRAAFRRWYEGDVVEVKTRNGRKFTTTPNHPMLTQDGWVSAGLLNERHKIVCDNRQKDFTLLGNMDIERSPSKISEIFDTLQTIGITERRCSGKPDFHGDGVDGEVDTASADRELRIGQFAPIVKPLAENIFSKAGLSGSSFCVFCSRLLPVNKSTCFCDASKRNASLSEPVLNGVAVAIESLGQLLCSLASLVASDNLIGRNVLSQLVGLPTVVPRSELSFRYRPADASLSQNFSDLFLVGTNSGSNFPLSHPGKIELDDVVSVRLRPFSGHVYNLETSDGYFNIAGGAYTGNTMRAHSEGQLDSMERQGVDEIGIMVEWSTSGLGTTALGNPSPCKVCAPLEGIVLKVSEARGMLPRHVNCITGDSVVIADDVNSLMKSHFTGQIVKLITSAGRELSITPNHVLLTQFGFVPAKFIHEGIKIVQAPGFDTESVDAPNDQGNVTTISDVFAAFSESGAMTTISMPLAAEDIHGDGQFCNSEVNIIRPNGELRDEVVGALRKEFPLISFKRFDGKRSLSLISPANQLLKATAFASDSSMGLFRDFFAVLLGGLLHSHKAGLRSVTFSDTRILEAFVDYVPATLELLSQCQNTHPILKHLTDSVCRQVKGVLSSGAVRDLTSLEVDSTTFKAASDAILAHSHTNSYFAGTDTRLVEFDDVVSVETVHVVDLPVYDLETDSTVYRVNGLITSNCRCVWTPANLGEPSVGVAKRVYDEKTGKVVIRKTRQKKTKEQIERQLAKSLEASGGKKKSRWQGADAKISKKRPKSPTGR